MIVLIFTVEYIQSPGIKYQFPLATSLNLQACQEVNVQLSMILKMQHKKIYQDLKSPTGSSKFPLLSPLQNIAEDFSIPVGTGRFNPDKSL